MPGREIVIMLRAACVCVVLFFFAGLANAQVPSGNIFFGYSFERTNWSGLDSGLGKPNLHGWEASVEGKLLPWVGIVGDVSGHYGSQSFLEPTPQGPTEINVTGHEQEYLIGPRVSVPVGKFTPFAEGMIGIAHIHTGGTLPGPTNTSFAGALGGGIDYRIFKPLAARLQGDYLHTSFFSSTQHNLRLSIGLVLRF